MKYLADRNLEQPGVQHGFFSRRGGVSLGIYNSRDSGLDTEDDPACVKENRKRVVAEFKLNPDHLLTLRQVHGNTCVTVEKNWAGQGPEADAMVTDVPGLALGILTADCAPVL